MSETLFELPPVVVDVDKKQKRKWENAFQRWSDTNYFVYSRKFLGLGQ